MKNFFSPESIAIIGASSTSGKIGNDLLKNLQNFSGEVFPINPKGGEFLGRKFFSSLGKFSEIPDLAVIAIPAKFVENSLIECGEKKIKNVIIISAGFKEMGNIEEEKNLQKIGKKYGIRILGPNCLGMLNPLEKLNLSFAGGMPKAGNISLVSQSGAMAVALMDWAESSGIGFSKIISMGNKCDLNENDFLKYFENDDSTEVIVMYLESLVDGRKFFELCSRITPKKPIIIVKSGVSEKGSSAASSHTGALTGQKDVLFTALKQSGVHYTGALEDLFSWSKIFSQIDLNNLAGELAIVTNAGGPGVMATDNAEKYGVKLAEFSKQEEEKLMQGMPAAASTHNPIDILGDGDSFRYRKILENISQLEKKRNILLMLTAQTTTDTENVAREIISFQKKNTHQIVMVSFMGGERVLAGRKILDDAGILHFDYAKEAIKAFGQLGKQKKIFLASPPKSPSKRGTFSPPLGGLGGSRDLCVSLLRKKISQYSGLLPAHLVAEIFSTFNISYAEEKLAKNSAEAGKIFQEIIGNNSGEIVMKISSPEIIHKTDCGGVRLNISSRSDAEKIFQEIIDSCKKSYPEAKIWGITLQKMFPKSREVFVGAKRDKIFGEILLFGLGGIFVNIFEDISRRISPVSKPEISKMMKEIKSYPLLKGSRGEKSIDFNSLEDLVFKLQTLFHELPELTDIDLNPIFALEDGAWVIDGKFFAGNQ